MTMGEQPKEIPSEHFSLSCHECGGKLGILSLSYVGVRHQLEPLMLCTECLSKTNLDALPLEYADRMRASLEEQ